METTRLTSKGQLVIPKPIRDAVHAVPGDEFQVRLEGSRIILESPRAKSRRPTDWKPRNPRNARLKAAKLCEPVVLETDDDRG